LKSIDQINDTQDRHVSHQPQYFEARGDVEEDQFKIQGERDRTKEIDSLQGVDVTIELVLVKIQFLQKTRIPLIVSVIFLFVVQVIRNYQIRI